MERYRILDAWLERVGARKLWEMTIPSGIGVLACYQIDGQLAMVSRYHNGDGWEIFVPSTSKNTSDAALDEAAIVLGVEGSRGLAEEAPRSNAMPC